MVRSVAGLVFVLIVAVARLPAEEAAASPPGQTVGCTFAAASSSALIDPAAAGSARQSELDAGLSVLERRPIGAGPWYYGFGAQTQQYFFGGAPALGIDRLQETTAQLSLEYFVKSEAVASIGIRPGLYYGNHAGSSSWDSPVQIVSGIPVTDSLAGVVGGSDGRLYHHAIAIAGVVWTLGPHARVEAVYPEPALVIGLGGGWEFRLGGELSGDGFMVQAGAVRTRMEFYGYRVSAGLSYRLAASASPASAEASAGGAAAPAPAPGAPGAKLTLGAGSEVERVFDFYEVGRRLHARPSASFELGLELFR